MTNDGHVGDDKGKGGSGAAGTGPVPAQQQPPQQPAPVTPPPPSGAGHIEEEDRILLRQVDEGGAHRRVALPASSSAAKRQVDANLRLPTVSIAAPLDETPRGNHAREASAEAASVASNAGAADGEEGYESEYERRIEAALRAERRAVSLRRGERVADESCSSEGSAATGLRRASSTSDVHSTDDAASIASRLSQIVDEQEFLLNHHKRALLTSPLEKAQQVTEQELAPSEAQSSLGDQAAASAQQANAGKLAMRRIARPPLSPSGGGCRAASQTPLSQRNRTKSFAGRPQGGASPMRGAAALAERRNESSSSLLCISSGTGAGGGQHFGPERGDLRSLELSRNRTLAVRAPVKSNSFSRLDDELDGELMLNIRRSAWKLDEFEQAFRPRAGSESGADFNAGDQPVNHGAGAGELEAGGRQPQAAPLPQRTHSTGPISSPTFEREPLSRSSSNQGRNLLIRSSLRRLASTGGGAGARPGPDESVLIPAGGARDLQAQRSPALNLLKLNLSGEERRRYSHSDAMLRESGKAGAQLQAQQQQQQQLGLKKGPSVSGSDTLSRGVSRQQSAEIQQHLQVSDASSLNYQQYLEQRRGSAISNNSLASTVLSGLRFVPRFGVRRRSTGKRQRINLTPNENDDEPDNGCCSMASLRQCLPVLEWLPNYNFKRDFCADLAAGLAVAVLNISTSLSAAVVAETELGTAFRSSIFNTFIYAMLCSSRHTSFGSWSIMSQMLLDSVQRALSDELILSRINLGQQARWNAEEYEMWHLNIIIMYTFLIGLVQLVAGLLNLGNILASFIPEALCSSMIAATAFTMAIGQLANMCGTSNKILWAIEKNTTELAWADLKNPPVSIADLFAGTFRWIQQIALLVKYYDQINLIAVAISVATVALLYLNQYYLQDKLRVLLKRKKNLFIPFEMILLIIWICVSYALDLRDYYHVATGGAIFIDFKLPNVPNLRLFRELWFDSLATALISYTMVFIMAKTYSNKLNYEIDCNQELVACGAGNLIGSLFDALPATASFSRTAGQVEAGGRTQMASIVNCVALVVLSNFLGHHVAHLPICVMAATLFFGFAKMMTRFKEVTIYWRSCRVDFAIWLFTCIAILALDLVYGFVYGFIFSIFTMLYRAQNRRCYMLGSIGEVGSDVYVPIPKYPLAREIEGIKVFQFCGPIHYVCADLFERLLRQKTRINVKELLKQLEHEEVAAEKQAANDLSKSFEKKDKAEESPPLPPADLSAENNQLEMPKGKKWASLSAKSYSVAKAVELNLARQEAVPHLATNARNLTNAPSHIILDFSMISFIDSAGLQVIKKIIVDHQRVNITIMFAALASHVAKMIKSEPSLWEAYKDRFYVTLADAVHHAMRERQTLTMIASITTTLPVLKTGANNNSNRNDIN